MKKYLVTILLLLGVACGGPFANPDVVSIDPPDGATDVEADTAITATFTKSIAPPTVQTDSFIVRKSGDESETGIDGDYDTNGTIVIFRPDEDFDADSEYEVILNNKIKDLDNNGLGNDVTAFFTTAS